ncbi:hypothetical protein LOK49_LG01G02062 [Camellia lanceoleosa]|uniref:Uncharacterized protein n=1 Tax=Camellia lanceoleosa TaxID=1840588 RepID=A0ACC0J6T0_9ERIC|nr:hypothetical protein LOK49_LG01G02062 [Camellia lanceoleosa]
MLLLALKDGKIKIGSKQSMKLRDDLYTETIELCMDFNCVVAIILTSKTDGSIYSFGLPSVESVVQAYLNDSIPVVSKSDEQNMESCHKLYRRLKELEQQRKAKKKSGKKLKSKRRLGGGNKLWDEAYLKKLCEDIIARLKSMHETSTEPSASAFASSSSANEDDYAVEDDIVKHA